MAVPGREKGGAGVPGAGHALVHYGGGVCLLGAEEGRGVRERGLSTALSRVLKLGVGLEVEE